MKTPTLLFLAIVISVATLPAQDVPGKYPFTSTRAVVDEDVSSLTVAELRLMRNEVFARYGYVFKSEDLKNYFSSQPWYKASRADVTALLTPLEKKNIDVIRKWETRMTNTSEFDSFYEVFSKAVLKGNDSQLAELVWVDWFESPDEITVKHGDRIADIKAAIQSGATPTSGQSEGRLYFGEYANGVQYHWIEFQKMGCCWYIYAFRMAG